MTSAFPRVPEELVSAILAPHLSIPLSRFNDTSSKSPFNAPDHLSTSVILIVCKQWLRVATPLLYDTVIIRSKRQAASLEKAIKSNPSLGKFIKRLRLEGPYGKTLERIVRLSPEISDLCLCFKVVPEHEGFDAASLNTLIKALPSINPTSLNINVAPARPKASYFCILCPKRPMNLIHTLESGVIGNLSKWSNLATIHLNLNHVKCVVEGAGCHDLLNTRHRDFAIALGGARSVQTVHLGFGYPPSSLPQIITMISKNPSIRRIDLRPESLPYKYLAHPIGSDTLRLDTIIHVNGRSPQGICTEVFLTSTACAIASEFDDVIWHQIMEHAIAQAQSPMRTTYLLIQVCKRFQKLGIPILYRHPMFSSLTSFRRFLSRIHDTPSVRPLVERITLFVFRDPPGLRTEPETEDQMAKTFLLLPNIKSLECRDKDGLPLPWEAFEAICETSAESMTDFRPGLIIIPADERLARITVFQAFKNITRLRWNSSVGFDVSDEGHGCPLNILSSLVELEYIHKFVRTTRLRKSVPSLLAALCHLELPALRVLLLSGDACPEAVRFFQCHGTKIEILELDTCTENPGAILQCCPSLSSLTIAGNAVIWSKEYRSMFKSCSFNTHPLEKIKISSQEWLQDYHVSAKELKPWTKLLDPAVYDGFTTLREIQVSHCRWPEGENEMKINHWPKISAKLMAASIKLLDRDGRCWIPRMGDTTSRMQRSTRLHGRRKHGRRN